ncbi:DUF2238 domain-containing protein [Paenibacillus radicis (ex Xue et al. 2023)]|uniref:DUF2238 domain-containing protein n=1 Tax=Paenibacillus radicis (ex Xue et al. 2023) TaxID=2972489 RepID=A0ABT1YLU4_9BACL|nr:DUF2238 domain-containing protein [Paenibacillus radicis (ex Xue et al. 2023)]MCR8634163.1 DUF2238 domain-containing protein [Paenibacillus radicis (ex Xue et al. 2023)]
MIDGLYDFTRPFRSNRMLQALLAVYLLFWVLMAIEPYNRFNWFLENLLIFATITGLVGTYRRFAFTNMSYLLIVVFLVLHTFGANYSYHTTPLDSWIRELFHTERDGYDRVVHFSYGLLLAYPIREFIVRSMGPKGLWDYALPVVLVLASGAFYELFEMWVALLVAPEIGTLFLGTQGDPWDTQHDMELAMYGAILTMVVTAAAAKVERSHRPR